MKKVYEKSRLNTGQDEKNLDIELMYMAKRMELNLGSKWIILDGVGDTVPLEKETRTGLDPANYSNNMGSSCCGLNSGNLRS